jgi:hypothetical protein
MNSVSTPATLQPGDAAAALMKARASALLGSAMGPTTQYSSLLPGVEAGDEGVACLNAARGSSNSRIASAFRTSSFAAAMARLSAGQRKGEGKHCGGVSNSGVQAHTTPTMWIDGRHPTATHRYDRPEGGEGGRGAL